MKTNPMHRKERRLGRIFPRVTRSIVLGWLMALSSLRSVFASHTLTVTAPPPPGDELRANLGTIGVVASPNAAMFSFEKSNGRAGSAADGAATARDTMFEQAAEEMGIPRVGPLVAASTIALTPVAALIGAAKEMTKKVSPEELTQSEQELSQTMSEIAISPRLRDHFTRLAKDKLYYPFRFREIEPAAMARAADYRSLANRGIDTVLELGVENLRLQHTSSSDLSYALSLTARPRLLRVADGAVLYDQPFQFRSGTSLFIDWTSNKGEALRNVAETGCRYLAEQIVKQIFVSSSPRNSEPFDHRAMASPRTTRIRDSAVAVSSRANHSNTGAASRQVANDHQTKPPTGVTYISSPPAPAGLMVNLGRIGIISTGTVPNLALQMPLTKKQAAEVEAENLTALGDDEKRAAFIAVTGGLGIPVLAVGDFVAQTAGTIKGVPEEQFNKADSVLHRTAGEINLQETLRKTILLQAQEATAHRIVLVKKPFPPGEEEAFSQIACVMAGTLAWMPEGQTPAYYLTSQGIDTALEIQLLHPAVNGLHHQDTINPPMAFNAEVRARLFRVKEGDELYSFAMQYRGRERKFAAWAANNAGPLRDELENFSQVVAATLIEQLSLRAWPPEMLLELVSGKIDLSK